MDALDALVRPQLPCFDWRRLLLRLLLAGGKASRPMMSEEQAHRPPIGRARRGKLAQGRASG